MRESLKFPNGFLWGTSTSAYQIEGGIENNDWLKVYPAGLACDHYNRYEEDFDLMKKLNQNAYRFSIEWSRIEPEEGKFNKKEIERYFKISQSLKSRGIEIMVTLHHFTLPVWLAKIGGFSNIKSIFYFSRFAKKIFLEYQNSVDFWITFNEPLIYASKGYLEGAWPPQKKNLILFLKVLKNQIASHKKIYQDFHNTKSNAKVGIAKNNIYFEPANRKSPLDKFSVFLARYFWNEYFLNRIGNRLDFIGLNYYFHNKIKFPFLKRNENKVVSDVGWEVYPEGIYYVLKGLRRYNLPIYITENGLADEKDKLRTNFIKDHLFWIHKAIQEGVDARGYFHWSLMDNFEWEKGFDPKFGLVEIDYKTLERKPRQSAFYYAQVCKNNSFIK
ncbi:glycoside hydrolase family 1 protein [Patescibacteria group bacterium]|nr:glycoside hydrolase family 1 protein [Patescibacteria group bacterium]